MTHPLRNLSLRIAVLYLLFGLAWILLSDSLVAWLFPRNVALAQTVKGVVFIVGTAALLYPFTRRMLRRHGADRVRLARLWQILEGVRRINFLTTAAVDEEELIRRVCDVLVEDLGLDFAWVVLLDEEGRPRRLAGAGPEDFLADLRERVLGEGLLPPCVRQALSSGRLQEVTPPHDEADRFGRPADQEGAWLLAAALTQHHERHGAMVGGVDPTRFQPSFLRSLFQEAARDVAYACSQHGILARERRARRLLGSILDNIPVMIGYFSPDGTLQWTNPAWRKVLGWTEEDMARTPLLQLCYPDPEEQREVAAFIARADGEFRDFRPRVKDGTRVDTAWANVKAPDGGVIGIGQDIRDRKRFEEEQRRLHAAVEQIPESVVITDTAGDILYVNPAFEKMTGYAREEVQGRNPSLLSAGEQPAAHYQRMWETISQGSIWEGEFINRGKDGRRFVEESVIAPIVDDEGGIVAYVAVKRDVTGEREARDRLRQSQKMEALGTLAGGIAHDFNNILQGILGYTTLIQDDLTAGSEDAEYVQRVLEGVDRARELVRQVLTFSRQSEQPRQPLLLHPVVKEALKLLRGGLPSNIRIHEEIASIRRPVLADPAQIHQVVLNLCTNAGQAMAESGGVLTVRLQEEEGRDGPALALTVRDTGRGMDPSTMERIFEPYFTTRQQRGGTGLGLSVVHGIVTSYGGSITVSSRPGEGATFRVVLPALEPAAPETAAAVPSAPPRGQGRILFVDDEAAIAELARKALPRFGYEVVTRTSSVEALELLRHEPDRFDALVTDMTMPNMLGTELAEKARELRRDLPVLICTGFSELLDDERARRLGIQRVLHKPLSSRELAEALGEVLEAKA